MTTRIAAALGFVLLLSPQVLKAQVFIQKEIALQAYNRLRTPVVHSFARAFLVNSSGTRVYKEVILGHRVLDDTAGFYTFNARIVSENGYANSTTGDLPGNHEHCYFADLAAHVNSTNQHEVLTAPMACVPSDPGPPEIEQPEENCPILLDLAQDGFHLSGTDPAVSFDIDADGIVDRLAWTKAGEDDAFLCLDRNDNGVIDNGGELFGYATLLLSGERARIGYRALADLDEPALGGNRDGKIDALDGKFSDLCAWVDRNRDGISGSDEILTLDQVGLVTLEYGYRQTRLVDSYGNLFRYVSRARMRDPSGVVRPWPTFDVIFAEP